MGRMIAAVLVLAAVLAAPGTAPAYDWDKQKFEVGVKVGMIMAGEVYFDPPDRTYDTESGSMFAIRVDSVISPKMSAGLFLHQIENSTAADVDISTTSIGGTLKLRYTVAPNLQIRPGMTLGYNIKVSSDAFNEDATGLEVGALLEAALHLQNGHMLTGELGFVTQPAGGNSDVDMTYGPTWYLLIGYAFGN